MRLKEIPDTNFFNLSKICCALCTSSSLSDCATKLGISKKKLDNIMDSYEFKNMYNKIQERMLMQASGKIAQNLSEITDTVVYIAKTEKYPVAIRLNACRTALEYGIKYTEITNILQRVAKLEEVNGLEDF